LDQQLQPVPVGVAGQLLIGGEGLARGYLNGAELTAEKFIPHPFSRSKGARLYQTGDLARYRSDGNIEFLGRMDGQVKLRGYRIELGEVEVVLSAHPAVREAVVVALAEESADKRLVAYVVAESESELQSSELRAYLREKLPEYMVPASYVMLERIPLTPNGKVDGRALPQPDTFRPQIEVAYVAPRNPVEEVLTAIWSKVLNIMQIGVYDNFFTELGGHSLIAAQLISRVRDTFKVELPLRRLFETPTIAGLAEGLLQTPGQRLKVEKTAELLIAVQKLSPDEVESMLLEKTSLMTEGGAV
jgi:acyl carrier protein